MRFAVFRGRGKEPCWEEVESYEAGKKRAKELGMTMLVAPTKKEYAEQLVSKLKERGK